MTLEAGSEAEAMEEHYLLVCSPWLVQPAFTNHPEPSLHCPNDWALQQQALIKKMPTE